MIKINDEGFIAPQAVTYIGIGSSGNTEVWLTDGRTIQAPNQTPEQVHNVIFPEKTVHKPVSHFGGQ